MSNLDLGALKEAEEDLKSRGGGGLFIRLAQDETKDIRILDPTPSMNGLYYIEVPIWWIDGKPITSPEFIGESDLVQDVINDYESVFAKDGAEDQFKKLRNASKGQGMKLLQKTTGFWIPVLEFDWVVKNNQIDGITSDGKVDPILVKKFIKDGKVKILDAKMSLLKGINRQLTAGRVGSIFLDQDEGFNLLIQRAGTGRDTTYTAQKEEQMPMPAEFYGTGALDVVEIAKSTVYTNEYIEDVLANYFEGTQLPNEPVYRFPELRDALKNDEPVEEKTTRRRRGGEKESEERSEKTEPTEATGRRSRGAKEEEAKPAGRRKRDLVKDATDARDE